MDGYYMAACRTDGMSRSDIKNALWAGRLGLCPYGALRQDESDNVLNGFLHRGMSPDSKTPRCMDILALGKSPAGIPVARIELIGPETSDIAIPAVCTYCPRATCDCDKISSFLIYDVLQDDPVWNGGILADD